MNEILSRTDFFQKAKEEIRSFLPDELKDLKITLDRKEERNKTKEVLKVMLPDEKAGATLGLPELYEYYLTNVEQTPQIPSEVFYLDAMYHLSNQIAIWADEAKRIVFPDITKENYKEIKKKLVIDLTGIEGKEDFLKDKPHKLVGSDLAIVYKIELVNDDEKCTRATVSRSMLEDLGIDELQLHEDALEMSQINCPATVMTLYESAIGDAPGAEELEQDLDQIVVSNKQQIGGAAALFYPGVMDQVAERLHDSYYILPSSIHELIMIPERSVGNYREIEDMVKEINRVAVDPKDRLSDHVYHYDSKEKIFERADAFENRMLKKEIMKVAQAQREKKTEKDLQRTHGKGRE